MFDALCDTAAEAANMKARSDLLSIVTFDIARGTEDSGTPGLAPRGVEVVGCDLAGDGQPVTDPKAVSRLGRRYPIDGLNTDDR